MTAAEQNDPRSGGFVWGTSEESFNYDSFGELLKGIDADTGLEVGMTVFYGERVDKTADAFMPDAGTILEHAADAAADFGGEWAEDFGQDATDEACRELESMLGEWAKKHLKVTFFQVENIRPYTLTAEDVASAREAS